MIKLVAFDWNGTLLADTAAVVEADNVVFEAFGAKPITIQQFRNTFDVPFLDYYVANGLDRNYFLKRQDKVSALFHEAYEARAAKARTRSGVRQALAWLKKHEVNQVVFSNHTMHGIALQLGRLGIQKYFEKVLARSDLVGAMEKRNKGAKLESFIEEHKYHKSEVLIVGDTIEEIDIARTLDIKSVAITGGYNSAIRLKAARPDFLIHNMVGLENIIKNLNA